MNTADSADSHLQFGSAGMTLLKCKRGYSPRSGQRARSAREDRAQGSKSGWGCMRAIAISASEQASDWHVEAGGELRGL